MRHEAYLICFAPQCGAMATHGKYCQTRKDFDRILREQVVILEEIGADPEVVKMAQTVVDATPETPDFTKVRRFAVVTVYAREGALGAGATRQATNGDWVRFTDYESLRLAHEQVTQENARLRVEHAKIDRSRKSKSRRADSAEFIVKHLELDLARLRAETERVEAELARMCKRCIAGECAAESAEADLAALRAAVREFLSKLAGAEEAMKPIYGSAHIHGVKYVGPDYSAERDVVRSLLQPDTETP